MKRSASFLVAILVSMAGVTDANAASIEGVFRLSGPVPSEKPAIIPERGGVCAGKPTPGLYAVSADGSVANVAVWLEGVPTGKPASGGKPGEKRGLLISNDSCRISPLVGVGLVGDEFVFKTDGNRMHNFHLYLQWEHQKKVSQRPLQMGATVYNVAFPNGEKKVRKPIKEFHKTTDETGFIKVKCNLHDWERGTLFIFDHPYAAVTDQGGGFSFKDVPPGKYTLRWWHEGFGGGKKTVEVKGDVKETIELKAL